MNVRELIEELTKHPPDLPVLMSDWNEGYEEPEDVRKVTFVSGVWTDRNHTGERDAVVLDA